MPSSFDSFRRMSNFEKRSEWPSSEEILKAMQQDQQMDDEEAAQCAFEAQQQCAFEAQQERLAEAYWESRHESYDSEDRWY